MQQRCIDDSVLGKPLTGFRPEGGNGLIINRWLRPQEHFPLTDVFVGAQTALWTVNAIECTASATSQKESSC